MTFLDKNLTIFDKNISTTNTTEQKYNHVRAKSTLYNLLN